MLKCVQCYSANANAGFCSVGLNFERGVCDLHNISISNILILLLY